MNKKEITFISLYEFSMKFPIYKNNKADFDTYDTSAIISINGEFVNNKPFNQVQTIHKTYGVLFYGQTQINFSAPIKVVLYADF